MQGKHMMPDGHRMSDKEMEGMKKDKKMKKKMSGKSYSKGDVEMARKMMS